MPNAVNPPPLEDVSQIQPVPSDPPQVRAINALGAALVLVLSQLAEFGLMGIASFMFWHGKIDVTLWAALAGAPIVGPGIAKMRGKSVLPTTVAVLAAFGGKASIAGALGAAASRMQLFGLAIALSAVLHACAFWNETAKPILRTITDVAHELCLLTAREESEALDGITAEQFCAVETNVRPFIEQILAAKQAAAMKAGLAPPSEPSPPSAASSPEPSP